MMANPIPSTVLGAPFSIVTVDPLTYVRCTRCHKYLADVYVRPDGVFGSTCIHKAGGIPTQVYSMVHSDGSTLKGEDGETLKLKSGILEGGKGEI